MIGLINVKDYDVSQSFKSDQPFTRSATQIEARKRRIESEKYYFEVRRLESNVFYCASHYSPCTMCVT